MKFKRHHFQTQWKHSGNFSKSLLFICTGLLACKQSDSSCFTICEVMICFHVKCSCYKKSNCCI